MNFYTNFTVVGNSIGLRCVENGSRVTKKVPYQPSLFFASNQKSEYSTIYGQPVKRKIYNNISEAYSSLKENGDIENLSIYGNNSFAYCYIADEYEEVMSWDINKIRIAIIDIETESKNGFPKPEEAMEIITAITYKVGHLYYVFGCGEYKQHRDDIIYKKCKDEWDLLQNFINVWKRDYPDIVTGWNISGFDFPYLINRITRILGFDEVKKLSPWGKFGTRTITLAGTHESVITISGVAILDYLWLYKKFILKPRESYKLDNIAKIEIGEGKVEIDNIRTIHETDFQKFIEYNIVDVELIKKLDDKLYLLERAAALAYDAKVNFEDALSQTRIWDNLIFLELKKDKKVIPFRHDIEPNEIRGAFNLQPEIGSHDYPVCFDIASLYPNVMLSLNMSPETLSLDYFDSRVNPDFLLENKHQLADLTNGLVEKEICLAANGHCFDRHKEGFLTRIIKRIYSERKDFKAKQLKLEHELEMVKEELKRRNAGT